MVAAGLLGLYGLGLPLSLVAMVLWARGGDDADPLEDGEDDDDDDTTVAVRRIQGGALLQGGNDRIRGDRDRDRDRDRDPADNSPSRALAGAQQLSGAKRAGFSLRGGGGGGGGASEEVDVNLDAAAVTSSPTLSGEDGEDGLPLAAAATAVTGPPRPDTNGNVNGPSSTAAAAGGAAAHRAAGPRRGEWGQNPSGAEPPVVAGMGRSCCGGTVGKSKAWRASGRWVLAVRKAMSSKPDSLEVRETRVSRARVCVRVSCVFFICIARANWLANEMTSAFSGKRAHKRVPKRPRPLTGGSSCVCRYVCVRGCMESE